MWWLSHAHNLTALLHVVVVLAVLVRVISMRPQPGVALAWLLIVSLVPVIGVGLYVLFGERRIGRRRAARIATLRPAYDNWFDELHEDAVTGVDWSQHPRAFAHMNELASATLGIPTLVGNKLTLLSDTEEILRSLIRDADAALSSINLEFYIWHPGGTADEVVDALVRAAGRGVRCRILVDALGSARWWRTPHRVRLQEAGVSVVRAMPVALWRSLFARGDLRLHRKIAVFDGLLAYTGSMNLVDPRFFKAERGVGAWIDAMVRVEGPAVEPLLGTLLSDWQLETGETVEDLVASSDMQRLPRRGQADILVYPSGPGVGRMQDGILQMLLKMIYAAEDELIITTPYFVPDASMLVALRAAASQGVRVVLIVPAEVDSVMVRYASRSYFVDLMEAGVEIQLFHGGLLHTKSMTVDGRCAMFGTVNLDMRSLWLNYELTLFVYDDDFSARLRSLSESYLQDCTRVDETAWLARPARTRFVENAYRLLSPLL